MFGTRQDCDQISRNLPEKAGIAIHFLSFPLRPHSRAHMSLRHRHNPSLWFNIQLLQSSIHQLHTETFQVTAHQIIKSQRSCNSDSDSSRCITEHTIQLSYFQFLTMNSASLVGNKALKDCRPCDPTIFPSHRNKSYSHSKSAFLVTFSYSRLGICELRKNPKKQTQTRNRKDILFDFHNLVKGT